jgi:hypothetical protein
MVAISDAGDSGEGCIAANRSYLQRIADPFASLVLIALVDKQKTSSRANAAPRDCTLECAQSNLDCESLF